MSCYSRTRKEFVTRLAVWEDREKGNEYRLHPLSNRLSTLEKEIELGYVYAAFGE
jgi:hypothetical protein